MSYFDYKDPEPERSVPGPVLLADASEAEWSQLLDHMEARRFAAGQTVLAEGGGGRSLYLVLEGTLEVVSRAGLARTRRIRTLEAGSMIGEVSFFDGEPRSVEVRTLTQSVLAEMTLQQFEALAVNNPDLARRLLLDLGAILAGRLRAAEKGQRR